MPKKERARKLAKQTIDNPETLDQLGVDQTAWVTSVELPDGQMRRRLQDLGIIEGTRVVCKQIAPSGNPKSFLVRGATIAIRTEDSKHVFITTKEPSDEDANKTIDELLTEIAEKSKNTPESTSEGIEEEIKTK